MMDDGLPTNPTIVYDGACPFCSAYARLYRAQQAVGPIAVMDARQDAALVRALGALGYDLNAGYVFVYGGEIFHGHHALVKLAQLGRRQGVFNWANGLMFRHAWLAKALYPSLRAVRDVAIWLRGRGPIGPGLGRGPGGGADLGCDSMCDSGCDSGSGSRSRSGSESAD